MIKAVLLDLDDTLLGNPTQRFVAGYMRALEVFLLDYDISLDGVSGRMMQATRAVLLNEDPTVRNIDAFYEAFMPGLALSREDFNAAVTEFYGSAYGALRSGTEVRPVARELVEWLLARDYTVIVATNPFFPRTAVEQRLAWAGLPVDEMRFRLVTTLENMHFAKPHVEYYEEILARAGVQSHEAVMVGDDWENDIVPAWRAGLNTWWLGRPDFRPRGMPDVEPNGYGSLDDFAHQVRAQGWLERLESRPLESAQIIPRLAGNLAGVLGAASEVPPHLWHERPEPDEWSPMEVLCRLLDSEREVQRPRLERIVLEDNPLLASSNVPSDAAARTYPEDGLEVAWTFARERQQTLAFLKDLPESVWERPARHSVHGPMTLLEMANLTAQHDRLHITQLCQAVRKCV